MGILFTLPSVQFSSVSQSCPTLWTPWNAAHQASLSITNSRSPPKPMSIESVMPFNHLILCHLFLLLPSVFPSIKVFSNELALHIRWPKYQRLNFSPSNEYSGLISFRIDWFDLLAVQRPCDLLWPIEWGGSNYVPKFSETLSILYLCCWTSAITMKSTYLDISQGEKNHMQ